MNKEDLILEGINLLILTNENINQEDKSRFHQIYCDLVYKEESKEDCCDMSDAPNIGKPLTNKEIIKIRKDVITKSEETRE